MAKYVVQQGRSLPTKIGLVRSGGIVERKNLFQDDEELKVLINRKVIKEQSNNPVTAALKRALNVDEKKRTQELDSLDIKIEEKTHKISELTLKIEEKEAILQGLNSAIEEKGKELESLNSKQTEVEPKNETEDSKESSKDDPTPTNAEQKRGPGRPKGVK